jgi:cytochrome c peroxidase
MHDGSIENLSAVVDFYAAGGRNVTSGKHQGDGRKNKYKSVFVKGFELSAQDKKDLLTFLHSLTDKQFLTNPKYRQPQ